MDVKADAARLRTQLISGEFMSKSPQTAALVSWGLNFCFGLVMSLSRVLGNCGPFGIAATARAGAGIGGFMCMLGASLGYLLSFGFEQGIKYVAGTVLVFTAGYVCQEMKLYKMRWFMPSAAAFFTLLAGFLGTIDGMRVSSLILPLITETILAGGCTYFFDEALDFRERDTESAELKRTISVIVLLSCLMIAVSRIRIAGTVSIGRFLSLLAVMTAAYKGGALSGTAAGATLGIAMDIAGGGAPFYSTAYAFSGLVSGIFSKHSRVIFTVSFIIADTLAVLLTWGSGAHTSALYESFAASVVFMLLPNAFLSFAGTYLRSTPEPSGESGLRRYTAGRIARMGEAFQDLYDTVDANMGDDAADEDISKIFDNASQCVCVRCKNKAECWTRSYMDTLAVFNDLTPVINSRGLVQKSDLPAYFTEKCGNSDELIQAINAELRARMVRSRFRSRLAENRSAAYNQYADVADILRSVSEELLNAYGQDALARRRLLRYLGGMNIDADASVFRDRSGRLHIILESARLGTLTRDERYLDKLSGVIGVRLCRPHDDGAQGRMLLLEAEPLSVSVGIASMKKRGERVSGDRGTYFKTDRGVLCVILSDGMGSGDEAAKESVAVVRILERFLRSGVEPETAMRMLNSMMLLKNGEEWGFATVDLMCIDLFTGEAGFYKYGAAPSYVRSGRTVKRVRSESLAAGLTVGRDSQPDIVKMRLKPGNLALIASDGVIADANDTWLRTLLCESSGEDTKALAKEALQSAVKQYGCTDDMTVLTIRVDSRE